MGVTNIAVGLAGGYPVTGSFSRTAVNSSSGNRSGLSSLLSSFWIFVILATLMPALANVRSRVCVCVCTIGCCATGQCSGSSGARTRPHVAFYPRTLRSYHTQVPSLALAAIISMALSRLVDVGAAVRLWRTDTLDFIVYALTFLVRGRRSGHNALYARVFIYARFFRLSGNDVEV